MQKSNYSRKEIIGWVLISLLPIGIIILIIGNYIGNFLVNMGFSHTLSGNISNVIGISGGTIMILGMICAPIGIIKVIKALRTKEKLDESIEWKKIDKNFKERFRINLIKGLDFALCVIMSVFVILNNDGSFSRRIIGIFFIACILRIIFSYCYRKRKEKEGRLYTDMLVFTYEGEIKNGKANGKGIAYFYDGTKKCEGTFKNGKLNGEGIVYYANETIRYKGNFKDGLADGKGTVYYQNGNIASEGTYKNDKLEGRGITYYETGEIRCKGIYKNGMVNGKSVIYNRNGNIASEGTYKSDKLEGKGITYYDNGEVCYRGNFRNGMIYGKGILYYSNGNKLQEGLFKDNKLEGKGKMFYTSGDLLYEGEFKSGKFNGKGIMYNHEGYEIYKGNFKNGDFGDLSTRVKILLYKLLFRKR